MPFLRDSAMILRSLSKNGDMVTRMYLQEMVDDIRFDGLPAGWNAFDIGTLSAPETTEGQA